MEVLDENNPEHIYHLMCWDWGENWDVEDTPEQAARWQRYDDKWKKNKDYVKAQEDLEAIAE